MGSRDHETRFEAMGSQVRLLIGEPGPGLPPAAEAAAEARGFLAAFDAALSRFRPTSELCALNSDRRRRVPASPLLRRLVAAGIAAAEQSGGLVDPTLIGEIEAAGYVTSRAGAGRASLAAALEAAPARRPARPRPDRRWLRIGVDEERGEVVRAPGLRIDSGGVGKGLAADLLAQRLRGYRRFLVDCGGDIRLGGTEGSRPYEVHVEHPLSGRRPHLLRLRSGAVATSGLNVRIWRLAGGRFAHHLLDPASGRPAWTGLVGATAVAATALEAETLAKAALLAGPEGGRELLGATGGGLLVHDSGRVEPVGALARAPRVRLPGPPPAPAGVA